LTMSAAELTITEFSPYFTFAWMNPGRERTIADGRTG
jgi:hypothetical protein